MSTLPTHSLVIIEPNEKLTHPYNLLSPTYHITRVSTITEGLDFIAHTLPSVVMLSASFSPNESVLFLDTLHKVVHTSLPKLIFVVDLSCALSTIPGTTWGGSTQILSSQSPIAAIDASLA
jgi:hypothetical protein